MSKISMIYCHVGQCFPDYILECIYQLLSINVEFSYQVFVILDQQYITVFRKKLSDLNIHHSRLANVIVVPSEILKSENLEKYISLRKKWNENISDFRSDFWIHTTTRFFYIDALITQFCLTNVFHTENDVMIYTDLNKVYDNLVKNKMDNKIVAVQDAPSRAICSIIFIPNKKQINSFTNFILNSIVEKPWQNDMDLMGNYTDKHQFPDSPFHELALQFGVFDACCIGQYLGGVDFRNIPKEKVINPYVNPTIGFINETSVFKPNTCNIYKKNENTMKYYKIHDNSSELHINAIHIHSKQLYLFSSMFNFEFADFITGDSVLTLCDLVFTDPRIFDYHKNLEKYIPIDRVLLVKNWKQLNVDYLHQILHQTHKRTGSDVIKLFVYIDLMPAFEEFILPILPNEYKYVIYSHNGDRAFDSRFKKIIESPQIIKIFAQNLDTNHAKLQMLPIGIANSMFPHGNLLKLYKAMIQNYYKRKTKSLYININPITYGFRREVLRAINGNKTYMICDPKQSYDKYLQDLSEHLFCLCLRGNGIDTHRFWESLYLGVIPVIIQDGTLDIFINNLRKMKIPHIVVDSLDFFGKTNSEYFNRQLYNSTLNHFNLKSIFLADFFKLGTYEFRN